MPTLRRRDKAALVAAVARGQVGEILDRARCWLLPASRGQVDPERVVVPDSAICRQAAERAREEHTPVFEMHVHRTYWWAALLGQSLRLSPDPEILFVSSVLHDLGLAERQVPQMSRCCFATTGAREAERLAVEHGWDADRAARVYEAISLHINPVVTLRDHGTEAHLLARAAGFDNFGMQLHRVPIGARRTVHARFPRAGWRDAALGTMQPGLHAPDTRPAFGVFLGIGKLVSANPLDEGDAS